MEAGRLARLDGRDARPPTNTPEMRQHIREALGPFDTGDPRWYGWLQEHLLRYGSERDSQTLMKDFLGRPVSPQALLDQIHRIAPQAK